MKELASRENNRTSQKSAAALNSILEISRRVHSERELAPLIRLIIDEAKRLLKADLVSLFLLDREKCELWSIVSQDQKNIRFDARLGIAGAAVMKGETINVVDAYEDTWFHKEIDAQTGYRTRTVLAVPVKNLRGDVIAVCEAINKKHGRFSQEDARILETFASQIADAIETAQFVQELKAAQGEPHPHNHPSAKARHGRFSTQNIIGMSEKIQSIVRLIDQIRDSSVDVLIEGESGTGKELVAKALHYNSPRAQGPFIDLNCASLPENLVDSELFGIEKGVATGVEPRIGKIEQAERGTLFMDEIGDLSPVAQAKILRVLQERTLHRVGGRTVVPVDIRIIAATNRNLETAIRNGQFREDLYYRLRVVHIQTPALREVSVDIPTLANHFLDTYCQSMGREPKHFTAEALARLTQYEWPGNIRELENEVKRLVAFVRGKSIHENQLNPRLSAHRTKSAEAPKALSRPLPAAVADLELRLIKEVLEECQGNRQKTAQILGLSRQGLFKKMKRYRIS